MPTVRAMQQSASASEEVRFWAQERVHLLSRVVTHAMDEESSAWRRASPWGGVLALEVAHVSQPPGGPSPSRQSRLPSIPAPFLSIYKT